MPKITELYDGKDCVGFEQRQDGYWWIRSDGSRTSVGKLDGARILRKLHTEFLDQRTPYYSECLGYVTSYLKHRAAQALYTLGKKLTG